MIIELNDKEKETLKNAMKSYERDLKGEINKTDNRDLKKVLHGEDEIIREILKKVA